MGIINTFTDLVARLPRGGSCPTNYGATVGSAANTTTETAIISATVPANTWLDGEAIKVEFDVKACCEVNGSSGATLTIKANAGAGSVTLFTKALFDNGSSTPSRFSLAWRFVREGDKIIILRPDGMLYTDYQVAIESVLLRMDKNAALGGEAADRSTNMAEPTWNQGGIINSAQFDSNLPISITAQWSVAGTNVYFNTIGGSIVKG